MKFGCNARQSRRRADRDEGFAITCADTQMRANHDIRPPLRQGPNASMRQARCTNCERCDSPDGHFGPVGRLRGKSNFAWQFKLIWAVQLHPGKFRSFAFFENEDYWRHPASLAEGVSRS